MKKVKSIKVAYNGSTRVLTATIGKEIIKAESITVVSDRANSYYVTIFDVYKTKRGDRKRREFDVKGLEIENIPFRLHNVQITSRGENVVELYWTWSTTQTDRCEEGYVPGQKTWINYYEYKDFMPPGILLKKIKKG